MCLGGLLLCEAILGWCGMYMCWRGYMVEKAVLVS